MSPGSLEGGWAATSSEPSPSHQEEGKRRKGDGSPRSHSGALDSPCQELPLRPSAFCRASLLPMGVHEQTLSL